MIPCSHPVIDGDASGIIVDMEARRLKLDPWDFRPGSMAHGNGKRAPFAPKAGNGIGRHNVAKEGKA